MILAPSIHGLHYRARDMIWFLQVTTEVAFSIGICNGSGEYDEYGVDSFIMISMHKVFSKWWEEVPLGADKSRCGSWAWGFLTSTEEELHVLHPLACMPSLLLVLRLLVAWNYLRERDKNVARDYDCHGLLYGGWLGSVGPRRLDITILLTCDEVGWYPETRD